MHRMRSHLRVLAATVLVLVSALGAWSSFAHGLDCHDRDGELVVVAHDASAHAFRSTAPPAGDRPVHCVLCHWTRALGAGVQSIVAATIVVVRTVPVSDGHTAVARLIAAVQPPLRAPPSVATLVVA